MNVGQLYAMQARKMRNKPAVIYRGRMLTHAELNRLSNQLAQALLQLGYQKGEHIVILAKNHLEYPVIMLAAAKIGVSFTPLNYRLTPGELLSIVGHCQPRGIFFTSDFTDTIHLLRKEVPVREAVLFGEETSGGKSANGGGEGWTRLSSLLDGRPDAYPKAEVSENDLYYIGYTSGTTGRPKGAMIDHHSRYMYALVFGVEFGIGEDDVQLVAGPLCHAAPHTMCLSQLLLGGTVVIMQEFDPEEVLQHIQTYRITNMFMAPTMYNMVLQLPEAVRDRYDVTSMKTLISAGSPLPTRVKEGIIQYFTTAGLNEFYGSTETGINLNLRPADQLRTVRSVGKPVLFNDILILDEHRNPVPVGEVGEIFIKNPYFFKGYLHDEEETANVFWNGYVSVGDMGQQDEDGYYYIVDRKKDMVISGGVNIFPAEIEDVLYKHPGVKEAAVIGVPDELWGEALKAFIVPKDAELTEEMIIDFCRQHLASYKKPKSVEFVQDLPRNPAGKILKRKLREKYWTGDVKV